MKLYRAAATAALLLVAVPAAAQEAAPPAAGPAASAPEPAAEPATSDPACELHVWPTQNYLGFQSGLLSGFGAIGAVADMAAHKGKVKTVKELMADYLGPDAQMEELNRIGIAETLKLKGYRIVVEEPTPFNEDIKGNPALKAKVKAMNARVKAKKRLTDSNHPCYAELITTHIFYHKAMMYGSNLFTGWIFRDFGDKPLAVRTATGHVKNPLERFPPRSPEQVEVARAELRDAFAKDFAEYVRKKVKP